MADSGPRTRRILTATFALVALIVAFLSVISQWQGIFGATSSLLAALGSRWGGFILIGLFMLLALWAAGHLQRICGRLLGQKDAVAAPDTPQAQTAASSPSEAALSRPRTLRLGNRVMNHDGTCLYFISNPDSHPNFHGLKSDEERVDGVTARLNAFHDEAKSLSGAARTTTEEWTKFWQEFNGLALRHMAIRRQTESIALAGASMRRPGMDVEEWARERFEAAAALIGSWLDGAGLTRFDLVEQKPRS